MADVQPLRALHYDTSVVGPLANVVAPPYDVIDDAQRAALLARSPFNVVAVDLPAGRRRPLRQPPRELFESWQLQGALVRDPSPRCGRTPRSTSAPTADAHAARLLLPRADRGVRPGPGAPPRAHPPRPQGGPPAPTRATRANISPIFSLYSDPAGAAWTALAPATEQAPWGEVPTPTAPSIACGGWAIRRRSRPCRPPPREAELLIADGHHRYETMAGLRARDRRRGRPPLHPDVPGRARGSRPDGVPHPPPRARPRRGTPRRAATRRSSATSRSRRCPPGRRARAAASRPRRCSSATSSGRRARAAADAEGPGDRRRRVDRPLRAPTATSTPACSRR